MSDTAAEAVTKVSNTAKAAIDEANKKRAAYEQSFQIPEETMADPAVRRLTGTGGNCHMFLYPDKVEIHQGTARITVNSSGDIDINCLEHLDFTATEKVEINCETLTCISDSTLEFGVKETNVALDNESVNFEAALGVVN